MGFQNNGENKYKQKIDKSQRRKNVFFKQYLSPQQLPLIYSEDTNKHEILQVKIVEQIGIYMQVVIKSERNKLRNDL